MSQPQPAGHAAQDLAKAKAKQYYDTGKAAFDRGRYRSAIDAYEAAIAQLNPNTLLGAEVQLALVMAYEAGGNLQEARDLCRKLEKHPDSETRKQSSRILYILEAPKLNPKPEWRVEIPDLSEVEGSDGEYQRAAGSGSRSRSQAKPPERPSDAEPLKLEEVAPEANRFLWFAIGTLVLSVTIWGVLH
ncbi:MAG: tetratricopeptide repeat protein [Prochlorothrix sp.]|nr:tetratricopeptide repeat protein [Prochlorothrix sp.]